MGIYETDRHWSDNVMQPLAEKYYREKWPTATIVNLDKSPNNPLATIIDMAGADKMIRFQSGAVAFMGTRFRRNKYMTFDHFTLRLDRESGGLTEYPKLLKSIAEGTFAASFYAYGTADRGDVGFARFRILDFRRFLDHYLPIPIPKDRKVPNDDGTSFVYWLEYEFAPYVIFERRAIPDVPAHMAYMDR